MNWIFFFIGVLCGMSFVTFIVAIAPEIADGLHEWLWSIVWRKR